MFHNKAGVEYGD